MDLNWTWNGPEMDLKWTYNRTTKWLRNKNDKNWMNKKSTGHKNGREMEVIARCRFGLCNLQVIFDEMWQENICETRANAWEQRGEKIPFFSIFKMHFLTFLIDFFCGLPFEFLTFFVSFLAYLILKMLIFNFCAILFILNFFVVWADRWKNSIRLSI